MITKINTTNKLLSEAVREAIELLGGMGKFIKAGERVFVKPNFNTSDPPPASSDMNFVKEVISLIATRNPKEIILGESPTYFGNSRKYFKEKKPWTLLDDFLNLKVVYLPDEKWISKPIPKGKYLKKASVPAILDQVDKIIWLPCLKTRAWAKYTGALKLAVGLLKPIERVALHTSHLQEKIAELNSLFTPDLIIMDARKCFINDGPSHGEIRESNLIMASISRIEIDIEGIKIIQQYEGNNLANIQAEKLPQIKWAGEMGVK